MVLDSAPCVSQLSERGSSHVLSNRVETGYLVFFSINISGRVHVNLHLVKSDSNHILEDHILPIIIYAIFGTLILEGKIVKPNSTF